MLRHLTPLSGIFILLVGLAFLSGCGVNRATVVTDTTPRNPFMEWFAVDEATISR